MIANFLNIFHWSRNPSTFLEGLIVSRIHQVTICAFEITEEEGGVNFLHKDSKECLNLLKSLTNSEAERRLDYFLMVVRSHIVMKHTETAEKKRDSFYLVWEPIADTYLAIFKDCGIPLKKWELETPYQGSHKITFLPNELDWSGHTHKITLCTESDSISFVNGDFTITYSLPKDCARNPEVLMEDEEIKLVESYFSRKIHQYYY